MVLVPFPETHSEDYDKSVSGITCGTAMVGHPIADSSIRHVDSGYKINPKLNFVSLLLDSFIKLEHHFLRQLPL